MNNEGYIFIEKKKDLDTITNEFTNNNVRYAVDCVFTIKGVDLVCIIVPQYNNVSKLISLGEKVNIVLWYGGDIELWIR